MKTVTSLVKNSIWCAATLLATVTYRDCTKKKTTGSRNDCVWPSSSGLSEDWAQAERVTREKETE